MTVNFDNLLADLRKGEKTVNFTKRDGSTRRLRCTLQDGRIPPATSNEAREPNPDVLVAWDVEKNAWRSFRKDSVLSVED